MELRTALILGVFFTSWSASMAQTKVLAAKPIPIVVWADIPAGEMTVERFLELKEMGANTAISIYATADAMQQGLDLAQKAGIKMITSCPELKTDPEKTVKRFMAHPALSGYFLKDEPIRSDFADLGMLAKKIGTLDSEHFCYVNLIASIQPANTTVLGTATYAEYVSTFAKEVPSKVLSFDFYPVLSEGIHDHWYEGLEIFSSETNKLGKPFWAFALASSYNQLHPLPTLQALRLQMYSNLAYGAQGLQYWAYWMSQSLRDAPIGLDGKRTGTYDKIKEMNAELQNLAGVFMGSKLIAVKHTGVIIPQGTSRLTTLPEAIKVFETDEPGALVSTLENKENTFFVVQNRDQKKNLKITILGDETLKRVLKDGSIVKSSAYASSMDIEPGDIVIYMYPTKTSREK